MPAGIQRVEHVAHGSSVRGNMFEHTDAGHHVIAARDAFGGVLILDVEVPVYHALRPVVVDVINGSHHWTARSHQAGQRAGSGPDVQNGLRPGLPNTLEDKPVFDGPLVDSPERLRLELVFRNVSVVAPAQLMNRVL